MWSYMFESFLYPGWESSSSLGTKNRFFCFLITFVQNIFKFGPTLESQHLLRVTPSLLALKNMKHYWVGRKCQWMNLICTGDRNYSLLL